MPSWEHGLKREKATKKLIASLLREDVSNLRQYYDGIGFNGETWEIKTWLRSDLIPIETASVMERDIEGWALKELASLFWFVRVETNEALSVPGWAIKQFLDDSRMDTGVNLSCRQCEYTRLIRNYEHSEIHKYELQETKNKGKMLPYHSACLFVSPEAFPMQQRLSQGTPIAINTLRMKIGLEKDNNKVQR